MTSPTIPDVERIAALGDPVLRNLQITQCYHELALALAPRTAWSANWCTFATWASKQAGQTIRKEDLARTLKQLMDSEASSRQAAREVLMAAQQTDESLEFDQLVKTLWEVLDPRAAVDRSSDAVARGNLKVFAEIGREFARFNATCLGDPAYDAQKINHFCEALRPGEPPQGQDLLRRAFQHYYQALFEEDEKRRTELMLLANLEIGFHEQTRLQPEINEALAAPILSPEAFTRDLLKALHPEWGWLNPAIWFLMRLFGRLTAIDSAVEAYLSVARDLAQRVITAFMMTIELPQRQVLRLGRDLSAGFPAILKQLSNTELLALLERIDPTPDSTAESGAEYWGNLPDRLHFIADMFRCYQTSADLFEPPFSTEQTAILKQGALPPGRL
jgi:hypothetical protein